jgi:agmatinase
MSTKNLWGGLNKPHLQFNEADFVIVGLPFDEASSFRKGSAHAPDKLREISYHIPPSTEEGDILQGFNLLDMGNWTPDGLSQEEYFKKVEQNAAQLFGKTFPIFIGGDHSVTIPLLKAIDEVYKKPVGIIHLDAHLDLCDKLDGNLLSHGCTHRRGLEHNSFSLENTCFVGIRSFEIQEIEFIKDKNANIFTSRDIYLHGVNQISQQVVEKLADLNQVYLTLDIDILDPGIAPGTGTPKAGGLNTRELLEILRKISQLPLIGMDIVEVSPPLDTSDVTSFTAQRVITEMLGFLSNKR